MNFKEWLYSELSYQPQDIPKWFYVGARWNPDQLAAMKLTGLRGITSNYHTAAQREKGVCIVMDGPQTEKINQLSRVLYEPEYMASKGWEAAKRVFYSNQWGMAQALLDEILPDYLGAHIIGELKSQFHQPIKKLSTFLGMLWKGMQPHIDKSYLYPKTWEEFNKRAREIYLKQTQAFQQEAEWIVKNEILNIPPNTILLIDVEKSCDLDVLRPDTPLDTILRLGNKFREGVKNLQNYQLYFFTGDDSLSARQKLYEAAFEISRGNDFSQHTSSWKEVEIFIEKHGEGKA
jgi:hypothetical protein